MRPPSLGFRLRLEPSDRTPAYVQLERQVRVAVAAGTLRPGDRLASVRRAAQELQVSTSTVSRAYAALTREGVIVSRPGGASVIAPHDRLDQPGLVRQRRERIESLARQLTVRSMALGVGRAEVIDAVAREFAARGQTDESATAPTLPSSEEAGLLSARNRLRGVVTTVRVGEVIAEVTLQLTDGTQAVAVVTTQSLDRLDLKVGAAVVAHVKATEITLGV